MSNQIWLPKDAALLKELREAAKINISALAIDYALSKTQIKQLEEGGDSSFYSPVSVFKWFESDGVISLRRDWLIGFKV